MTFSDKLRFLLNITETTNAELARAMCVDPSMISRLRRGVRKTPRNRERIQAMSEYFAQKCPMEYQLSALYEAIGSRDSSVADSAPVLASQIFNWLVGDVHCARDNTAEFVDELFLASPKPMRLASDATASNAVDTVIYSGNDGKRKAVRTFIERLKKLNKPCEILVATDESVEWLLESHTYRDSLEASLRTMSDMGFSCLRITSPPKDASVALDSLTRWMPHILSGKANTYFYPRRRDNYLHRTLIISPGVAAMVSTSVGSRAQCAAAFLTSNIDAVDAFQTEFMAHLKLCKPMLNIYDVGRIADLALVGDGFTNQIIRQSDSLPLCTAPACVAAKLRADAVTLRNISGSHKHIDIINLNSIDDVFAGRAPVAHSQYLCGQTIYYTPEEYGAHINSTINYLINDENYHIVFADDCRIPANILYIKQRDSVAFLWQSEPSALATITERKTVDAFWEYMVKRLDNGIDETTTKRNAISRLRLFIRTLEKHCA